MDKELKQLIEFLISKKGGSPSDYRLLLDKIGYHESRSNPKSLQLGGGPGRGKYQFEIGKYQGGKTAANRAKRYYEDNGQDVPEWLKNINKDDSVDASKLSESQQDILFLTNMLNHPKADLGDVIGGKKSVEDFWADFHWAGDSKDRSDRIKSFNESMKNFKGNSSSIERSNLNQQDIKPLFKNDFLNLSKSPFSNQFSNGGIIDPPGKSNNGVIRNEPPKSKDIEFLKDPIGSHIENAEEANKLDPRYPLKFTKTESRYHTTGADRFLQDRRAKFLEPSYINRSGEKVNFDKLATTPSSRAFLERYNNPVTRQRLLEQTDLNEYDIDNAILQGLTARKEIGDNVPGSKASFTAKDNLINFSPEYKDDASVETHERVHASNLDAALGIPLLDVLGNPFEQKSKTFLKRMSPETLRYLNRPYEAYGNFSEFREQIGLKPGEQIDANELRKRVKSKGLQLENFYQAWDDDKIVKALNTIADTNTPDMNINQASKGGLLKDNSFNKSNNIGKFNSYNEGGLHENNPNGGIPLGMGSNGKLNTVEEGETSYDFEDGKYIFSDRIGFDSKKDIKYPTPNQFANGGSTEECQCGCPGKPPCPDDSKKNFISKLPSMNNFKGNSSMYNLDTSSELGKSYNDYKKKDAYYNPSVKKDITSGSIPQDILYNNQWLFDTPILGRFIKNRIKSEAEKSFGVPIVNKDGKEMIEKLKGEYNEDGDIKNQTYEGKHDNNRKGVNLLDEYFKDKKTMKPSIYKPKSDYLQFLDSYSIKEDFDKDFSDTSQRNLEKSIMEVFKNSKLKKESLSKMYDDFIKNRSTVYSSSTKESEASKMLNANLGGHKVGLSWDKDKDLPYMSVSDAWDFSPKDYSEKWTHSNDKSKETAYIQSSLMHKAGKPFKIYDRFYFDPKTKKYMSDEDVKNFKNKKR